MTKRGTVLLVANYASDVGYAWWLMENFWSLIADEMRKQGRSCILAFPKLAGVSRELSNAPLSIVERRIRPTSIKTAVESAAFLLRNRVTSVYLTDWPGISLVYLLWRLVGVRVIVMHDHTPGDRPRITGPRAWLKRTIHRASLFSCTLYVGVSDYVRRRFSENWCVPESKSICVQNGIRLFSCEETDSRAVRSSIGVPDNALVAVLVSRATHYKGWDFALACLSELLTRHPHTNLHLVFCGDGPALEDFRDKARELNIRERAHFLGRRDDVRRIVCSADFAFHPSKGEALSLAIIEFMCAGLPVVVPDRPSVCTLVRHGVNGLVYSAESHAEAVDALHTLVTDLSLRGRLGSEARKMAVSECSLDTVNRTFVDAVVRRL